MKPRLLPDWKRIVRRAWSVRLMLLAGALSGLEVVLPALMEVVPWSRAVSSAVVGLVVMGAFVTRLLAQKDDND